jgi:hypothetical protein
MREVDHTPAIVAGRTCGECSMCCKIMNVDEFEKPQGVWCRHCAPGRGRCTIHDDRPPVCRNYSCGWLISSSLGAEWKPSICKMLINFEKDKGLISVHVDSGHPGAWRRQPYYGHLKQWARQLVGQNMVVVFIKRKTIVVLPDKDVELGDLGALEEIRIVSKITPNGRAWDAIKTPVKAADPSSK